MLRLLAALGLCLVLVGCVHENPDARLDPDPAIDARDLGSMLKLDCSQRRDEVQSARDEAQSDFDRLANYRLALKAFTAAAQRIESAFSRQPDLLYIAEGDALRLRLQRCQAQARTFTDELRKFELGLELKSPHRESEAAPTVVANTAAEPEPAKRVTAAKKTKKSKSMIAKRKKAGRPHAVLADASR